MKPHYSKLNGIWFTALFALASMYIANLSFIKPLSLSPLIIGIVLGMVYGNTLREHLPAEWTPGIAFSAKKILRFGIILYGFNITYQEIAGIGLSGLLISIVMVTTTFLLGALGGIYLLRMDRDTSLLTASGSSICGAAAVLATESQLKSEPYKTAVAVSTVVLFGTISMFLYPAIYKMGWISMPDDVFGLFLGGSVHEVAHVVAAGNAVSPDAQMNAIIVKMTRVILLVPMLLLLGLFFRSRSSEGGSGGISIPWFAFGFLAVAAFHSFITLPEEVLLRIKGFDTFLLTMAMSALGMESSWKKMKQSGTRPFLLAFLLFLWLALGGLWITDGINKICHSMC